MDADGAGVVCRWCVMIRMLWLVYFEYALWFWGTEDGGEWSGKCGFQ